MTNPNDPVIPTLTTTLSATSGATAYHGLTKLELFSGLAMNGILSDGSTAAQNWINKKMAETGRSGPLLVAELSLDCAKALIAELNKEGA